MITAEIIADSVNPAGVRLTTFVCKYPRFIHSEVMTHRMISKNASSSRAIPVEKMIQAVMDEPAMPIHWGKNQKGMQADEYLTGDAYFNVRHEWDLARFKSVEFVKSISEQGLHKQVANRLLEPWTHMTTLMSATEWANFFALRVHKDAQPEFQELAYQMLKTYVNHKPELLYEGQWHLPFRDKYLDQITDGMDHDLMVETTIKACIGRCARVSYKTQDGNYSLEDDLKLYDRLANHRPLHATPMEHVAFARDDKSFGRWHSDTETYTGSNFRGWTQYRKTIQDENVAMMDFAKHLEQYERETNRV